MLKILSSKPENSLGRLYTEEKNQPYRSLFNAIEIELYIVQHLEN